MTLESVIRLGCFLSVFIAMALWERNSPRRKLKLPRPIRWRNNLSLVALNSLVMYLVLPAGAVGFAAWVQSRELGLLNWLDFPIWLDVILAVIILDFVIWAQHVMVHYVPLFWRLHRVHHADPDYDITTGSRFHPLEIVLSMMIKLSVIWLIAAPMIAVLIFEVILNVMAVFNHGNVSLPSRIEKPLRRIFVTPDMHRVHHSTRMDELNRNFGFNLSVWDRLFHTYKAQPDAGHTRMEIGLKGFDNPKQIVRLSGMLAFPFIRSKASTHRE